MYRMSFRSLKKKKKKLWKACILGQGKISKVYWYVEKWIQNSLRRIRCVSFGGWNDAPRESTPFSACSYIYGPRSIEKV